MIRSARRSSLAVLGVLAVAQWGVPARSFAAIPRLDHVIVVIMENKGYDRARAQKFTASLAESGTSFSDYHAIAHPSQPNYLALWSGGTQGVSSNGCPAASAPFNAENLGHACEVAGLTWRAYSEDLPSPGSDACKADRGLYTRKHEPWTNFANLNHQFELPYTRLAEDIAAHALPNLAFVIPNNQNNSHSAPIEQGDAWLAANMPMMLDAVGSRGIVILTWDEDDGGPSNHILTVISGLPVKHGFVVDRAVTHYTLLRTVCDAFGLPAPGAAASESAIDGMWDETLSAGGMGETTPAGAQ